MKKCLSIVSFMAMLMIPMLSFAGADYCETATVMKTGVATSGYTVNLRNDSGGAVGTSDEWANGASKAFFISPDLGDAGLAVFLTAIASGKTVKVGSPDHTYPDWGTISFVYIKSQ